jgi:hypothetical protein
MTQKKMEPRNSWPIAVDHQSEGRNTLLVLAQFCLKCSEDVQCVNLVSLFSGKLLVGSHQCSFDLVGLRSTDTTSSYLLYQPS